MSNMWSDEEFAEANVKDSPVKHEPGYYDMKHYRCAFPMKRIWQCMWSFHRRRSAEWLKDETKTYIGPKP